MAADYTRNIVFNVNDKAIKRATDRITRSLTNIEKTLQRIEKKGFNNLAKSAEKASNQVFTTTDSIRALEERTKNLGKVGKDLVNTYGQAFQRINKVGLNPLNDILRDTVGSFKLITFAAKRSGQDLRTIFEFFNKGRLDIISFTTAIGAALSGIKNFGTRATTNLTKLGTLLDTNAKKAGTFINVLGLSQGLFSQPKNIFQNTEAAFARNTALARQNSMRGNVLRNTIRSERSRTGSDFLDFSIGADQIPRVIGSRGRPANMQGPDRPGIQDPIAKSIRRNQAKRDRLLQNELRIRKNILKVEQQSLVIAKTELSVGQQLRGGQGFIGPKLPMGFRLRQQFQEGGLFGMPGGMRGRIKGGVGSALIGGGFPALFGAGGISSAFGAVAGGAGGALAPGGGFAASIFATAIAAQIEKAIAFNKAVDDLNVSIRATGGTSLFSSKQVAEFAKSLGMTKDEALEALKAFKQFEASARIALTQTFGSEATFDIFAGLKDNASLINALPGLSKELSLNQAQRALDTLKTKGVTAAEDQLLEGIINKNNQIIKQEAKKLNFLQRQLSKLNPFRGKGISAITSGSLTMDEAAKKRGEDALAKQRAQNALALERLKIQRDFNEELERQAIIKAPVDELNKLLDPLRQVDALSKSIGDSFTESFKGIIKGSMTAQEALRNLFQRTADHFIDMAAQILAAQIRAGIMGLFANAFGGGGNVFAGFDRGPTDPNTITSETFKANGGPVKAGSSYIVGERGPELFSPGVSGMITPNEMLGGSTNIVVNVDASGSSVEGDEQQGRELGRLISVAVQSELIQQKRPGGLLA